MKRNKIAIVCSYYPWPPSVGGIETIVRNVSVELAKRGYNIHVITTPFDVTSMCQVAEYGIEEKNGVIIHNLQVGKLKVGYARFLNGLKEVLHKVNPNVVHSHNLHPHLFQLAKWRDEMNYKLLTELHHPSVEIDHLSAKAVFPLTVKYLVKISRNIDVFIAHTEMERNWLIKKGINADRVHKVTFPCVPSWLVNYTRSFYIPKDYDLLFAGRATQRKGLHILIKSLKHVIDTIEDVKLTIIGPSDKDYIKHVKNLIAQLKLHRHVNFKGVVSEEEKYDLIAGHKILILPSLRDYTPNILLEGQALGVPVIATKVGAVSDMMIHGETGLQIQPDNPTALAEAIKRLLLDDDLRKMMSIKAKEFSKGFILEKTVDNLENLYNNKTSNNEEVKLIQIGSNIHF